MYSAADSVSVLVVLAGASPSLLALSDVLEAVSGAVNVPVVVVVLVPSVVLEGSLDSCTFSTRAETFCPNTKPEDDEVGAGLGAELVFSLCPLPLEPSLDTRGMKGPSDLTGAAGAAASSLLPNLLARPESLLSLKPRKGVAATPPPEPELEPNLEGARMEEGLRLIEPEDEPVELELLEDAMPIDLLELGTLERGFSLLFASLCCKFWPKKMICNYSAAGN